MTSEDDSGRGNQRLRTRRDLLRATARLLKDGQMPTMEEIAEEAMVSRATAYRYFPNLESLLVEAPLEGEAPSPEELFANETSTDPEERLEKAESALHDMAYGNEVQLRLMLSESLRQSASRQEDDDAPLRQNRRMPLIEAALAPVRNKLSNRRYAKLCASLALIFGAESMIVFRDVHPLAEDEARVVKRWAIGALVRAAFDESNT